MFKVCIYISPTGLEVVSSLLRSVRETVLAGHAGVAGGDRDGSRKYRSTGRAPQAHGGHVVCRTSNSAPRCHKVNSVGRERLPGINCSHDFRRRPVQAGHKLRHDHTGVLANILATGREGELILGPRYIPSYGGHEGGFHTPDSNRHGCHGRRTMSCGTGIPAYCSAPAVTAPVRVWPTGVMKVDSIRRIQIVTVVTVVVRCHAELASRHTVQHQR